MGLKKTFDNSIHAYLDFYELCLRENISLNNEDKEYLINLYNLKYFRKSLVTENDRMRAYDILYA